MTGGERSKHDVDRYAVERRRQLTVLLILAAAILVTSVLVAGVGNVFPHNWWHIDLPWQK